MTTIFYGQRRDGTETGAPAIVCSALVVCRLDACPAGPGPAFGPGTVLPRPAEARGRSTRA